MYMEWQQQKFNLESSLSESHANWQPLTAGGLQGTDGDSEQMMGTAKL